MQHTGMVSYPATPVMADRLTSEMDTVRHELKWRQQEN
jgi:hypothetical protein